MVTTTNNDAVSANSEDDVLPELIEQNDDRFAHDSDRVLRFISNLIQEPRQGGTSTYLGNSSPPSSNPMGNDTRSIVQSVDEEPSAQMSEVGIVPNHTQNQNQHEASGENSPKPVSPSRPPLTGIEACIDRIMRNPILVRDSSSHLDTFIYIGRLCLQNHNLEDQLQQYFCHNPILMERSKLEALNSPYFNKCFSGMYQTRKWKALSAKIALHVLPPGIRYIINMTPEIEGAEAVQSLQDLSCPFGILHWGKSYTRWSTRAALVGGLDENDEDVAPGDIAMEYSCVRHVKSIERFMTALQGNDPKFDTAPKLYTAVMVSKAWGIQAQHPLIDYVARWLCENNKFIEAFPEITLKMADVLKCAPLCQDAFGILVGEAALDSSLLTPFNDGKTTYGRVLGDIEEDWLSRIQHARNSFIDRVRETFNSLAGEQMEWVATLYTISDMRVAVRRSGKASEFDEFLHLLKGFIRGSIYKLLCNDYQKVNGPPQDHGHTSSDDLYPHDVEETVWESLRAPERIFTARFWKVMARSYLKKDNRQTLTNHNLIRTEFLERDQSPLCKEYGGGPLMKQITAKKLIEAVSKVNSARNTVQYYGRSSPPGSNQLRVRFVSKDQTVDRALSSLKEWTATSTSISPPRNQLNPQPIQISNLPGLGSDNQNQAARPFAYCSNFGCAKIIIQPSISSVCLGCQHNFCEDHIVREEHRCFTLIGAERTSYVPQRQQYVFPQTQWSDDRESSSQDTGYGEDTIDPAHSIPLQDQKALSLIQEILFSAVQHLQMVARQMLSSMPGGNLGSLDGYSRIAHTLNCLGEDEIKYLPLWAEGLDDGTGGVFGEHVPAANEDDLAFRSNGRRLVTKSVGSDYSFASEAVDSTVNTSTIAHDGHRDTLPRKGVIAVDETDSSSEGGWSYIQDSINDQKGKSRADHTQEASELATTIGAFEDDSVIDLEIIPRTVHPDKAALDEEDIEILSSIDTASDGTVQEANEQEDMVSEDSYHGFDEEDPEYDDMDMIYDDDLDLGGPSHQTPSTETKPKTTGVSSTTPSTISAWNEYKSMAHVSYIYKDGPDHDLMTRP